MTAPREAVPRPGRTGPLTVGAALLATLLGFFAPPIVLGDLIVTPPLIHGLVVLAALFVFVWVAARTGRPRLPGRTGTTLLCLTLIGIHAVWSLPSSYTILDPTGPDGCRVIVRESAFFMSGEGSVGVVGRHGGPVSMRGDYSLDDGGEPVKHGDYRLTWGNDLSASLVVAGAYDPDPIEPDLSCR